MEDLQTVFKKSIVGKLQESLGLKNKMDAPELLKIVINVRVRDAVADKKNLEKADELIRNITGQKSKVTAAKQSIAGFKLRQGDKIGLMVTLRGKKMYDFFTKIISVVLPRFRDFHGVKINSFDGHGNYTMGFSESSVFPEVDPGKVDKVQGLEVSIVTTAKNDKEGFALLEALGMPFEKNKK